MLLSSHAVSQAMGTVVFLSRFTVRALAYQAKYSLSLLSIRVCCAASSIGTCTSADAVNLNAVPSFCCSLFALERLLECLHGRCNVTNLLQLLGTALIVAAFVTPSG